MKKTRLLIVGSGPYGLAAAAYAKGKGIDFLILGIPMEFWDVHMPKGMFLRSGADWHIDPLDVYTFEAFLGTKNLKKEDVDPIPVELFREYGCWFADRIGLRIQPSFVRQLVRSGDGLEATLHDGSRIVADDVLVAPGFRYFANVPEELAKAIPGGRCTHTCEFVDFDSLRGKRCLIIGGRQSALESAALIHEAGAEEIHLSYRHETPRFEPSDWDWVNPMMDSTENVRGWYRWLPADQRSTIQKRFWAEGRLKLEPWLLPRIDKKRINLWPRSSLQTCQDLGAGLLTVRLSNGQVLAVHHILLATGYRVDIARVPYLTHESIASNMEVREGFPALDENFQTSIPGLYMAGLVATKDFGPFYGFVRGCRAAARIIVNRMIDRHES